MLPAIRGALAMTCSNKNKLISYPCCLQVGITEQETSDLQSLDAAWTSFCHMLDACGSSLERSKESFRERLLRSIEATTKEITEARDRFLNHAPFSHVVRQAP